MSYIYSNNTLKGPGGTTYTDVRPYPAGRVGYAYVGGQFRVRVEPSATPAGTRVSLPGWLQPSSSNNRFSIITSESELPATIVAAVTALKAAEKVPVSDAVCAALVAAGL